MKIKGINEKNECDFKRIGIRYRTISYLIIINKHLNHI